MLPPTTSFISAPAARASRARRCARIASGNHSNVSLGEGDTVIFSSRIIPGNELAIFELQNQLAAKGIAVLTERDHFVHVSGHPARDELAAMYSWVKPSIAVPVHGELRHMSEHARLARELQVPQAVVALNGQMVRLAPGAAEIIDETPSGRLHLDGRVLVHEDEGFARARRSLGYAGFIGVTLVLDRKGRVAADPVLHMEGIPAAVLEPVREAVAARRQWQTRPGRGSGGTGAHRRAPRRQRNLGQEARGARADGRVRNTRPKMASSGSTRASGPAGPEAMTASVPLTAPAMPPETGASIIAMPLRAKPSAIEAVMRGPVVERSTNILARRPSITPRSPIASPRTSSGSGRLKNTMSAASATPREEAAVSRPGPRAAPSPPRECRKPSDGDRRP